MLRSLYTAATAMMTQTRRMDVITNNLANVETRGFKQDTLTTRSFRDMMITRINDYGSLDSRRVGPHNTGIHIDQVYTYFEQGPLEETFQNTDMALEGPGFFVITNADGEFYTRAGEFNVDVEGRLVTPRGDFVMSTDDDVIYVFSDNFKVDRLGNVYINEGGDPVAQLRVVDFPDTAMLRKIGDNYYYNLDPDANPPDESGSAVLQGMLENSNVDTAREVVNMIEVTRNYETNQRILKMLDESLGRAVNDIARI